MLHIRYMMTDGPSKATVCDKPELLDDNFVIVDCEPFDDSRCKECHQLLLAHNKRAFEKESRLPLGVPREEPKKPMPSKGLVIALSIVLLVWLLMLIMFDPTH